jgi:predicted RNase H-like HicB family nuclease
MVRDSIMVYVQPNVKVSAGMDTTICPGYTITLTGTAEEGSTPYKSFKWIPTTGLDDPNILSPKLRILKSGTYNYVLSVTDALDCIGRDTVTIKVTDPPDIQITGDTLICDGTTTILSIEPKTIENTYLWSTGETTETITVSKEGIYSVEVTDKTGCTGLDTIELKTYPKTVAKLKLDRSPELCAGSKLNISTEDKYISYNWSTGNTEDNITVDQPGNYYVEVTDINGCKAISDTVKVTLVDSLRPIVLVSNNGILCPNGSLNLTTEYNYTTYLWSTGETTKTITITQAGKYSVHVKDDGGCEGTSEIIDIIQGTEPKPIISGSTILCPGRTSILLVQNDFQSYKWNTGETTKSISITNPGTYSVTVTDTNGCEGTSSTTITEFKSDFIQLTDIDFGVRKVNSTSKKNIELKNTNTQNITIYNITIKGLEANTFTAFPVPTTPKTLNQNESINIEIDYLPTASKSYLDSLIIDITEPCIQTISIAVKGSASDSNKTQISTSVWIPDLSAKIGQLNFCIPLMAKKDDNEPYDDKVSYKAEITLDASVMNPTTIKGTIASGKRTIELTGDNIQLTENPTKIGEICGQIFIGDRDITPIEIINFEWSDKDIINKTTNGSIKVSGICQPNIARIQLINPVEFTIKQSIVSNELVISTKNTTNEDILTIYSIIGIEMGSYFCSEQMSIDLSGLASGVYFVRIGDRVGKFVKF